MTNRWLTGAAAAALTVAGAISAQAADLPTRKEAPVPVFVPPPFTWTGFYIGVNAGGIFTTGKREVTLVAPATFPFLQTSFPTSIGGGGSSGFIGGGQAGYNYQWGAAVFGIETDIDWTSTKKNFTSVGAPFGTGATTIITPAGTIVNLSGDALNVNAQAKLNWLGTTRGRIGFVATPDNRLMFYGTGGVAYGGGSGFLNVFDNTTGLFWHGAPSSTRVGWTLGAGVEYALTNNITIKGEYLYYNLGSSKFTVASTGINNIFGPNAFATAKYNYDGSILRAGVNYKF
jgi:outer membrane immunogenic protein